MMSIYRTTSVCVNPSLNKLKVFLTSHNGCIHHEYISRTYKTSSSRKVYGVFIRRILDKVKSVLSISDNSPTIDIPLLPPIRGSSSNIVEPFKWNTQKYSITVSNIKATLNDRVYILKKTVATPRNVVPLSTIEYKSPDEEISNSTSYLSTNSEFLNNNLVSSPLECEDQLNKKLSQVLCGSFSNGEEFDNNSFNKPSSSSDVSSCGNAIQDLNNTDASKQSCFVCVSESNSKYIDLCSFSLKPLNREHCGTNDSSKLLIGEHTSSGTIKSNYHNGNNSFLSNLEEQQSNAYLRNMIVLNPKAPKLRTIFYFQNKSAYVILPSKVDDINPTVNFISTVYERNNTQKPARINFIEFHKILAENNKNSENFPDSPNDETSHFGSTDSVIDNNNPQNLIVYMKQTSVPLENNNNRFWIPEKDEKSSSININEYFPKQDNKILHNTDTQSAKKKNTERLSERLMENDKSDPYITKIPIQKDKLIDETVVPNKSILNIINSIDKSAVIIQKDLYITDQIIQKIKNEKKSNEKNKLETVGITEGNNVGNRILLMDVEKVGKVKLKHRDLTKEHKHFNNITNPQNSKTEIGDSINHVSDKNDSELLLLERRGNGELLLLKPSSKDGNRVVSFSCLGSTTFRKVFATELIKKAAAFVEKEKYRQKKLSDEEEFHNKATEKIINKECKSSPKQTPPSFNSINNYVNDHATIHNEITSHTLFQDISNSLIGQLKENQKSSCFQEIKNQNEIKDPQDSQEHDKVNSKNSQDFLNILNEKLTLAINKKMLKPNNRQQKAKSKSILYTLNNTKNNLAGHTNPENMNRVIPCSMINKIPSDYQFEVLKNKVDQTNQNIHLPCKNNSNSEEKFISSDDISDCLVTLECPSLIDNSVQCLMSSKSSDSINKNNETTSNKNNNLSGTNFEKTLPTMKHFSKTSITAIKNNGITDVNVSEIETVNDSRLPVSFSTETFFQIVGTSCRIRNISNIVDTVKNQLMAALVEREITNTKDIVAKLDEILKVIRSLSQNSNNNSFKQNNSQSLKLLSGPGTSLKTNEDPERQSFKKDIKSTSSHKLDKKIKGRTIKIKRRKFNGVFAKERIKEDQYPQVSKSIKLPVLKNENNEVETPTKASKKPIEKVVLPEFKKQIETTSDVHDLNSVVHNSEAIAQKTRFNNKKIKLDDKKESKSINNYVHLLKATHKKDKSTKLKKKHIGFFEHKSLSKRDKKILKEILKGAPKKKKLTRLRRYKEPSRHLKRGHKELETMKTNVEAEEKPNQKVSQTLSKEPPREMSFAEKLKATLNPFASIRKEPNVKETQSKDKSSYEKREEINKKEANVSSRMSLGFLKGTSKSAEEAPIKEIKQNKLSDSEPKPPSSKKTKALEISELKKNENKYEGDLEKQIKESSREESLSSNQKINAKNPKMSLVDKTFSNQILSIPTKEIKTPKKVVSPPKEIIATPKKVNATKTVASTPKKVASPPKKVVSTPKKVVSTPKNVASTPKKVVSPRKKVDSPQKKVDSPQKKVDSPPKQVSSTPLKLISTPKKAASPPKNVANTPLKLISTSKKVASPPKKLISPPKKVASPPKKLISPPKKVTSPLKKLISTPRKAVSTPLKLISTPKKVVSPPKQVTGTSEKAISTLKMTEISPKKVVSPSKKDVIEPQKILGHNEEPASSSNQDIALSKNESPHKKSSEMKNPPSSEFNINLSNKKEVISEKNTMLGSEKLSTYYQLDEKVISNTNENIRTEKEDRENNYIDIVKVDDNSPKNILSAQKTGEILKDNKLHANQSSGNINRMPTENANSSNKTKKENASEHDSSHFQGMKVLHKNHDANKSKLSTPVKQPSTENLISNRKEATSTYKTSRNSQQSGLELELNKTDGKKTYENTTFQKRDESSKFSPIHQSGNANPSFKIYVATKPHVDSKNQTSPTHTHRPTSKTSKMKESNKPSKPQQEQEVVLRKTTESQQQDEGTNITVIEKIPKNVDTTNHKEKFQSDLMKTIKRKIELRNPINFRVKPVKVALPQNDFLNDTKIEVQKAQKVEVRKPKQSAQGGSKSIKFPSLKRNPFIKTKKQTGKLSASNSKTEQRKPFPHKIYKTISKASAKNKTALSEDSKAIKAHTESGVKNEVSKLNEASSNPIKEKQLSSLSDNIVNNVKSQKNDGEVNSNIAQNFKQYPNEIQQKAEHSEVTQNINSKTEKPNEELIMSKQEAKESNVKAIKLSPDNVPSEQKKGIKEESNYKKMNAKLDKQSIKEKEVKSNLTQTKTTAERKLVQQEKESSPFPMLLIDVDKMTKEMKPDFDMKNSNKCLIPLNQIEFYPLHNKKKVGEFVCPNSVLNICPSKDPVLRKDLSLTPSVTKILNLTLPKSSRQTLREWRKNKIRDLGENGFKSFYKGQMTRGTQFHNLIQDHLVWGHRRETPSTLSFQSVHNVLSDLTDLAAINSHVVHKALAYRGVVDCVAKYKGTPVVVEWKRLDEKQNLGPSSLESSHLQMSAYVGALNFDENYKFQVKGGVIVLAYSDGNKADVYEVHHKECEKYWRLWLSRLFKYHSFVQNKNNKG